MRTEILYILLFTVLILSGCAAGPMRYAIVSGESFASTDEAVQEAQLAINNAVAVGYRPISIGGGAGSADGELGGGKLVTVYVLMEGPANAPYILSSGIPVP